MSSQSCVKMCDVEIYDIDLHHPPKIGEWMHASVEHQFYIVISIDGSVKKTSTSKKKPCYMPWTDKHVLRNVCNSTTLTLEVFAYRHLHDDQRIGMVQGYVEQFLRYPGAILQQLTSGGKPPWATLEFKIASTVDIGRHAEAALSCGNQDSVKTPLPPAVQIFDIDLHHLPRIGLVSAEDRKCYVRAFVDSEVEDQGFTTAEKLYSLPWTTKLELNVQHYSTITLKVFAKRLVHEDEFVGMVQERVETLLAHPGTNIYRLMPPADHGKKRLLCASMEFKVKPLDSTSQLAGSEAVHEKELDVSLIPGPGPSHVVTELAVGVAASIILPPLLEDISSALPPLLEKINMFVSIAGKFAEAHPYLNIAFVVLTAAYKVVHAQMVRDLSVRRLVGVIRDIYSLISNADELKRIEPLKETVNAIARQTVECAYFIRHYMEHGVGWKNSVQNALSNIDTKVEEYEATFKKLQNALHARSAVQTQVHVLRLYDMMVDHAAKADFKDMHYATNASYTSHKAGSAPSRTDIMESITSWVNQDTGPQIYLLLGSKESERFGIAHAIAHQFDTISRLGSSYFFSHAAHPHGKRNSTNLFSTIAHDIAEHEPQYMQALWDIVKHKRALRETNDPIIQFDSFILAPAGKTQWIGPVLVVIDGLEYSDSSSVHKDVLTALAEKGGGLPPNFKLLITCRPDKDVCAAFDGKPHVLQTYIQNPYGNSPSQEPGPFPILHAYKPRSPHPTHSLPALFIDEIIPRSSSPEAGSCTTTPSSLDSSSSESCPAIFDNSPDADTESLLSSVGCIDEELHSLEKVTHVVHNTRVVHKKQKVITTIEIFDTHGRRTRIDSTELESWTVDKHNRKPLFTKVMSDSPLMIGSTLDSPPPYVH